MSSLTIRAADPSDLNTVETVEKRCFREYRRSSRRALAHSLHSPTQSAWLAFTRIDGEQQIAGAMILHQHPLSIRVYSLAVLPGCRGSGIGRGLMQHAILQARRSGRSFVTLECDRRNRLLTDWYETFGFETYRVLKDYYSPGRHAVRMRLTLRHAR